MASSAREVATSLGLRFQNTNGRLKFNEGGPTHSLWKGVLTKNLAIGSGQKAPFEEIIAIIDEYGPQVWSESNEELFEPGVHKLYPVALRWPTDRDK